MTDNQVFGFLSKFCTAHDVKIVMQNKSIGWWNILRVARQLKRGVPVAKIIKKKWFYGQSFITTKATLDPRPDSETLVDAVLKHISTTSVRPKTLLDIGTGTGCLVASIVKNSPNLTGVGIDISWAACRVAEINIKNLGLSGRVKIARKSMQELAKKPCDFDIIISNPPYIPDGDTGVNEGAKHDPKIALYGGKDGLRFYKQIAKIKAMPDSKLFIEIGVGQAAAIKKIFQGTGWQFKAGFKDLSDRVRVLAFSWSL